VPAQPRPGTPTPAAPGAKPEEQLRVVADPGTNSLIVYGTAQEFQNIKNILKELDAVPRQVLMDVLIAEVQLNNDERFGVDYEIAQGAVTFFGRTFGQRGSVLTGILSSIVAPGTGEVFSRFPQGITGIIGNSQTVRALINALQSDSRIRILSSPSVLASDNRPARIQVGSEEPIATGQVVAATGAANPSSSTTIQYRNTGRIVTIVPQVNSQGLVNLQILAEVSQRGVNVTVGTDSFPAFDIRQAETTAVVQNGDTLVIGGIIADNRSHDRTGIPYLMDIPVFGRFFGTTTELTRRTELIMLITPNVIRNREESRATTEEFKNKVLGIRNELERLRRDQERELERRKKLAPVEPRDAEPDQPTDVPPSPGAVAPGQQSPVRPANPTSGAAPDRGAMTVPPEVRSSDAAQKIQRTSPRDTIEIQLQKETLKLSASPAPSAATAETKESLETAPSNGEENNLAKAAVNETMKPASPMPEQVWLVQIASYSRDADARAIAGKLKDKGYNVSVVTGEVAGQPRYRVEVGPLTNRSNAQAMQKELATVHKLEQAFVLSRGTNPSSSAQPR
jgi:cell division septation protein DedD